MKRSKIASTLYYQEKQHNDHQAEVEKARLQAEENVKKLKEGKEEIGREYEEKLRTSLEKIEKISTEKVSLTHYPWYQVTLYRVNV